MDSYTDVYAHTFHFEQDLHAKTFARKFERWVQNHELSKTNT